jgi:hypothetical protein
LFGLILFLAEAEGVYYSNYDYDHKERRNGGNYNFLFGFFLDGRLVSAVLLRILRLLGILPILLAWLRWRILLLRLLCVLLLRLLCVLLLRLRVLLLRGFIIELLGRAVLLWILIRLLRLSILLILRLLRFGSSRQVVSAKIAEFRAVRQLISTLIAKH